MDSAKENITNIVQPALVDETSPLLRACALYSMNDMLFQGGMITVQKKQQVEQEIWKKYHI